MADGDMVTYVVQIGNEPSPEVAAVRHLWVRQTIPPELADDQPRTIEEWRVTGDPGQGYPPYRFTFRTGEYLEPELAARKWIDFAKDWTDGPHLSHRTVTYSAWEQATTGDEVVHLIADGEAVTSCCGRTPFELPRMDRLTVNPDRGHGCG